MAHIAITKIYPWVDLMQIIDPDTSNSDKNHDKGPKLLCIIRFNEPVNTFEILEMRLFKFNKFGMCTATHVVDITIKNSFIYEKREKDVIVRCGPVWKSGDSIKAEATIQYNNKQAVIKSSSAIITTVS